MRAYLFVFMLFCTKNIAHCDVIKISNYEEAATIISTADENTWVVFDVDEVLITFQNELMPKHTNKLWQYAYEQSGDSNIINLLYTPYKMKLTHPKWPNLIHSLQNRGVKTIALTKASSGKLGYCDSLAHLRYNTLRQHNIHFNRSFPELMSKKFSNPKPLLSNGTPLYEDGIIYTCGFPKGSYLGEFIIHSKQKPHKIIFIDNLKENSKAVESLCYRLDIESLCIHYTEVDDNNTSIYSDEKARLALEELQKDYSFFSTLTPPIAPQENPALLTLMQNATAEKTQETPYIDHIEWITKTYKIIQNTLKINTEKDSIRQFPQISNLTMLLSPTTAIEESATHKKHSIDQTNLQEIDYPFENAETIDHNILDQFDMMDAQSIIRPLLNCFHTFKLTTYQIGTLFNPFIPPFFKNNKKTTNPSIFYENQNKNHVFEAAQKTYDLVKNNVIFVLGQAPAYLGIMLQEIAHIQNDHETIIINVPFSGCPDHVSKLPDHYDPELSYLNIVTHQRESIFRNMLFEHYFSPKIIDSKKIVVIDYSSGQSFETFINLLKRWFHDEQITYPETSIIHLGNSTCINISDSYTQIFLNMDEGLLLAFSTIMDNLRIVPLFNAHHWREGYQKTLKQYPSSDAIPLIEKYKNFVRKKMQ